MQKTITHSAEETRMFAGKFARRVKPKSVIALYGDLGAGKTTFAQGFLSALGADEPYISPTFVIMKQYELPESKNDIRRVYHVDAYRIDDSSDIEKLGFEEWFTDPAGLVLVEWPEKLGRLLPVDVKKISLVWISDTEREIMIE